MMFLERVRGLNKIFQSNNIGFTFGRFTKTYADTGSKIMHSGIIEWQADWLHVWGEDNARSYF